MLGANLLDKAQTVIKTRFYDYMWSIIGDFKNVYKTAIASFYDCFTVVKLRFPVVNSFLDIPFNHTLPL